MVSLYEFLVFGKRYTEDEAEETCLRLGAGMELPDEVKRDVREYLNDMKGEKDNE